ncbi:MAG: crosslink repair DNA glycosylase YcaQ family protein [Betaproteobacteria bacterium]
MRFVQLDPIRAPARAADLILRQRVAGDRVGDLDRAFPDLPLAEDYLHVYGVVPASVLTLLHPRRVPMRRRVEYEHPRLSARVLAHVRRHGETHPRDVAQAFGRVRTASDWGGDSTATTRILEVLHHRGKLRVARRVNGVKVYAVARPPAPSLASSARAQALLSLLLELYAPLPEASFRQLARMVTESSLSPALCAKTFERMREGGDVRRLDVEGVPWLLPAGEALSSDGDDRVRLLTPFDPVVWDRRRFAAFWGWDYRLEAYTPPGKRVFGYYALPLLWREEAIGWANATVKNGTLAVDVHFVRAPPGAAAFRRELEAELERLRDCIGAADVTARHVT